MQKMRHGFTMIELIFVIVIIGILAAVAIPKLAATRDDAKASQIIANTKNILTDFTQYYTSQGDANWSTAKIEDVTNVPVLTPTCGDASGTNIAGTTFGICYEEGGTWCIGFIPAADATNIAIGAVAVGTNPICDAVVQDPTIIALTGGPGSRKDHPFGGSRVNR